MWTGYVLGRVWSLGQVSVWALGGGVITSGLVIGKPEIGQVLLISGTYVFAMALEFGYIWAMASCVFCVWTRAA